MQIKCEYCGAIKPEILDELRVAARSEGEAAGICAEMARKADRCAEAWRKEDDKFGGTGAEAEKFTRYSAMADALREAERRIRASAPATDEVERAANSSSVVVSVCSKCKSVIGDAGLCSYECDDDSLYEKLRKGVIYREYKITKELVREWKG